MTYELTRTLCSSCEWHKCVLTDYSTYLSYFCDLHNQDWSNWIAFASFGYGLYISYSTIHSVTVFHTIQYDCICCYNTTLFDIALLQSARSALTAILAQGPYIVLSHHRLVPVLSALQADRSDQSTTLPHRPSHHDIHPKRCDWKWHAVFSSILSLCFCTWCCLHMQLGTLHALCWPEE